jgi:hypothetical protein
MRTPLFVEGTMTTTSSFRQLVNAQVITGDPTANVADPGFEDRIVKDVTIQLEQFTARVAPFGAGHSPATTWTGCTDQGLSLEGLRESYVSHLVNGIETRNATASVGNFAQNMVSNYWGFHLPGNWRVTPKLTLNLGLREPRPRGVLCYRNWNRSSDRTWSAP